jgi:hypothetical protein
MAALIASCLPATSTTIHVPGVEPTIQAGIDAASPGDTVLVSCGTYYEHDIQMKSGVCLTSETGQPSCVTVDAQQQGRVFYCSDVDSTACIVGFTITGGAASGPYPDGLGGGMYCYGSSPVLTACTFSGNRAVESCGRGGGVACESFSCPTLESCTFSGNEAEWLGAGVWCDDSSPVLLNCTLSGNEATGVIGEGGGVCCGFYTSPAIIGCTFVGNRATKRGGGLYCQWGSSPAITDCMFSDNLVGFSGGGLYCDSTSSPTVSGCVFLGNQAMNTDGRGGGMTCYDSSPVLTDCAFIENDAPSRGGGLYCWGGSFFSLAVSDCSFSGNRVTNPTGYGGGISCSWDCSPALSRCTLSGNEAYRGGGLHCWRNSSPTLTSCTLSRNRATQQGGGVYCDVNSSPMLTDCIVAFNTQGMSAYCRDEASAPLLMCCNLYGNADGDWVGCVADQYGVGGNFSEDPLFCGMQSSDFALCANSPCLPDGNGCGVLIGAHGEGCADCLSVVDVRSWGAIKAMYR